MSGSLHRVFILAALLCLAANTAAWADNGKNYRAVSRLGDFGLSMALVNDNVWVFEIADSPVEPNQPVQTSIMVAPETPLRLPAASGGAWSSSSVSARINQDNRSIRIVKGDKVLFDIAPYAPDGQLAGISFTGDYSHLFGLGADYRLSGEVFNLLGETIMPGGPFGNSRLPRQGYRPNQVQTPVLYALGEGKHSAALFVDETIPLMWSLKGSPWTVSAAGPLGPNKAFRFFVISGEDLPALRKEFMALTGRPPVPPQKALGVWAAGIKASSDSEWRSKLSGLVHAAPGLAGILASKNDDIKQLLDMTKSLNLRLMVDESSYIPQDSDKFAEMARRSFLVRQDSAAGPPMIVNHSGKKSGVIDYTNNAAPPFWHSLERAELMSMGLDSFRLTDGDLDDFSSNAWYEGPPDFRVHSHYAWSNTYALKWLEAMAGGFQGQRMRGRPRLLLLTRTGTTGLARLAGTLYNGDSFIGGNRSLLAVKAHVSLSGIDYYSSDLSHSLSSRPMNLYGINYDAWLAQNVLTEMPLILPEEMLIRPATRYNLALRETLGPYLYSLAWQAYLNGTPIISPLVFSFQDDDTARNRTGEMMLGPSLLLGLDLGRPSERTTVYVPKGRWYNWRTGELVDQKEAGLIQMDMKDAGQITPPILAKSGAIIPAIEEMTSKSGVTSKIPALKIFIGEESSEFTWYEDDGETQNYHYGRYGKTLINATTRPDGSTMVTIKAREGSWDDAPSERQLLLDIYGPKAPGEATLNNLPHNRVARAEDLDQLESGWASFGNNRIRFKTPPIDISEDHVLWFK